MGDDQTNLIIKGLSMASVRTESQTLTTKSSGPGAKWEARLAEALLVAVKEAKIYETTSQAAGGLIYSGEFDLLGSIPVAFEARPAPRSWGCVEVVLAINPKLGGYPVHPTVRAPKDQGEGMAMVFMPYKQWPSPAVILLYVSRKLQRDLKIQL